MRKLVLALVVLVALAWIGWRMLPGPSFAPIGPERSTRQGGGVQRQPAPGQPRATPRLPGDATPDDAGPDATAAETGRGARRDLRRDEERGGHTIARHVGRTDAQLRERLARESISAASTYTDLETAERVVGLTLQRHAGRLERWEERQGPRPNLALPYYAPNQPPIGRVLRRDARAPVEAHAAVVVVRWRADGSYVLTSYPEERPRPAPRGGRRGARPGRQEP